MIRPYKFVVQAVVQQVDEDGSVVGETQGEPVVIFGCDALAEWAQKFGERLGEIADGRSG